MAGVTGKPKDPVWNNFEIVPQKSGKCHPEAICKRCRIKVSGRKERLLGHVTKCSQVNRTNTEESAASSSSENPGGRKRQWSLMSTSRLEAVVTSEKELKQIEKSWARFFYSARIPFVQAENEYFRQAIEMTRPGIGKKLMTRRSLAGRLLDDAAEDAEVAMKSQIQGKKVTISQDGWSNVHGEPILATSVHCDGKSFPLDSTDVGSETKTAEFCYQKALDSIRKAEETYGCHVIGFVSDNEPKLLKTRQLLRDAVPGIISYGCSAHYLNLAENVSAPEAIMDPIIAIQRFFREHHKPMGYLHEKNGVKPQLPNKTRWSSHEACLETFIHNHPLFLAIRDEHGDEIVSGKPVFPQNIIRFLDNRLLFVEAKNMLEILRSVKKAMLVFQSDSSTFGDAVHEWIRLSCDEHIPMATRQEIERRFRQVCTAEHILAYMTDPRYNDAEWTTKLPIPADMKLLAQEELEENILATLASLQIQDHDMFPKIIFGKIREQLSHPVKYWKYVSREVSNNPKAESFASLMLTIHSLPPSSAGIERVFSSMALVHTNLRNRLTQERVGKLTKVYRMLEMEVHDSDDEPDCEFVR